MPRGYWRLGIAALGWLILGGGHPPAQQGKADGGGGQPAIGATASPTAPHYAPCPDPYAAACYRAQDHDSADLCAQWRAALAAEKAAHEARRATNWAIVAAAAGALGFIGLLIALWQTQASLREARRGNLLNMRENARSTRRAIAGAKETTRALEAAERNAAAAAQLAKTAQDTANRQLRPYLYVVGMTAAYGHMATIDHISDTGEALLTFKNFGATPAKHVRLECTCLVRFDEEGERVVSTFHSINMGDLPPTREAVQSFNLSGIKAIHEPVYRRRATLIFRGKLTYRDADGTDRVSNFSFGATGDDYWKGVFRVEDAGNDAT